LTTISHVKPAEGRTTRKMRTVKLHFVNPHLLASFTSTNPCLPSMSDTLRLKSDTLGNGDLERRTGIEGTGDILTILRCRKALIPGHGPTLLGHHAWRECQMSWQ
jgi:hypothetical protein